MAMNFPDSPTTGDIFSSSGRSWEWNGAVWASVTPSTVQDLLDDKANTTDLAVKLDTNPLLQTDSFTSTVGVGWFTIAVSQSSRASANFTLLDRRSSRHQSTHFYAAHTYGRESQIQVLSHSSYSSGGSYDQIRIKEGGTYDGALLQVYNDIGSSSTSLYMFMNASTTGWVLKDFIPDGTDPGTVNNFAALTNIDAIVDLDTTRMRNHTLSTADPSGGTDGDVWLKYTA